jgi:hypothetical protein
VLLDYDFKVIDRMGMITSRVNPALEVDRQDKPGQVYFQRRTSRNISRPLALPQQCIFVYTFDRFTLAA